ncbi:MAG TPA: hypothetical protein VE571_05455, partial [Solirubrobacteraceae bacterium]|nr:hypothetical protein [Solirubrobacteraceae bacterium]
HTDPKLTLSVYQQVLDMGAGSIEVLEAVVGCSLAEAAEVLNGRGSRSQFVVGGQDESANSRREGPRSAETPPERGFRESG